MNNYEYGAAVISVTKTPNVGLAPLVKICIFIFVGINSSCLLRKFFSMAKNGIYNATPPPSTTTLSND